MEQNLKTLKTRVIELLGEQEEQVLEDPFMLLTHISWDNLAEPLRQILSDQTQRWYIRATAARFLGMIRDLESLPFLIEVTKNKAETSEVRVQAIVALGYLKDKTAFEYLVEALNDEQLDLAALEALGKLKDPRALEVFLSYLKRNFEGWRRTLALRGISDVGNESSLNTLFDLLKDTDSDIRHRVINALSFVRDSRVAKVLVEFIGNEKISLLRARAISALAYWPEYKDENATRAVIEALSDPDEKVIIASLSSLAHIGNHATIEHIILFLHYPNPEIRKLVIQALGKLGGEKALQILRTVQEIDFSVTESGETISELATETIAAIYKYKADTIDSF